MYNIFKKRPVKADDVKEVVIRVSHTEAKIVNDRDMPDISLQHMIAVMLMDGTASFEAAHRKRMSVRAVQKRAKVKLARATNSSSAGARGDRRNHIERRDGHPSGSTRCAGVRQPDDAEEVVQRRAIVDRSRQSVHKIHRDVRHRQDRDVRELRSV